VDPSNRIATLRMGFELLDRRDLDGLLALTTPDVEWPNVLDNSVLRGRKQLRAYWESLWKLAVPRVVPRDFVEEGDHVVVAAEIEVFGPDGKSLAPPSIGIHRFTFQGNLVARLETFRSGPDIVARIRTRFSTNVAEWVEGQRQLGESRGSWSSGNP